MSSNPEKKPKAVEAAEADEVEILPPETESRIRDLQEENNQLRNSVKQLQKESEKYVAWINRLKSQITNLETELMEALHGSQG